LTDGVTRVKVCKYNNTSNENCIDGWTEYCAKVFITRTVQAGIKHDG